MADHANESQPFRVETGMDLLLALLYAPGKGGSVAEPIEGITRLQKLMFLLQQDVGPKQLIKEAYPYKPYKMGPYSARIKDDLEELESGGIVVTERMTYWLNDDADAGSDENDESDWSTRATRRVESYRYSLSRDLGLQVGKDLWESLPPEKRDDLAEFKRFFNSLSLRQLLIFTYEKFPDYTEASTIKKQLGLFMSGNSDDAVSDHGT